MKPFLFSRGSKNYARFYVPSHHKHRLGGRRYLVFALGSGLPHEIRLKACMLENRLWEKLEQQGEQMHFDDDGIDFSKIRKFEINLREGIFKSEGKEDTDALMETLRMMAPHLGNGQLSQLRDTLEPKLRARAQAKAAQERAPAPQPEPEPEPVSLSVNELLEKFFLLKQVSQATRKDYTQSVSEFSNFVKNKAAQSVSTPDITKFREVLAEKKNSQRTIDKKVGSLKSLFNFAIEQGYFTGNNPAQVKNLLSKRQKASNGYQIFENEEIRQVFGSQQFKEERKRDPDYYWACLLALFTGARHDEVTQLLREQVKVSDAGTHFIKIRDSKTSAGVREVPLPVELMQAGFADFIADKQGFEKIFRYNEGNALGKKFCRKLREVHRITRSKLVLHSLRKFLNDLMLKSNVSLEVRCQFIGHELDNVNVATYSSKFNVDDLQKHTAEVIKKVVALAELQCHL